MLDPMVRQCHKVSRSMESHKGVWGEIIAYGHDEALKIISQLIVDDGVADRGHRTNIFKEGFKVLGSFTGPHSRYRHMTCIDYAGGMIDGGEDVQKAWAAQIDAFKANMCHHASLQGYANI